MKKQTYYSCDFETTSTENFKIDNAVRVWAACACDIENLNIEHISNNINDFMLWALKFNKNQYSKYLYFHNLKFDGAFILDVLLKKGFTHIRDRHERQHLSFMTLISHMGVWYSVVIFIKKAGKWRTLYIYDSLKKLPFSVAMAAKAYGADMAKGKIDYTMYRELGYTITEEEDDYIKNDCKIVATALQWQLNNGYDKMTVAADALAQYKKTIHNLDFINYFPLLDFETDDYMRAAYRGGYVYLNPRYANTILNNVTSFDSNSMYPDKMRNYLMPYGQPIYFTGKYKKDKKHPLYIQALYCCFELKSGRVPTIQLKNSRFTLNEYSTSSNGERVYLCLSSPDLYLLLQNYTVTDIEYIDGYMFRASKKMFVNYIDNFYSIKQTAKGGLRTQAKLMLNGLYGKFAKSMLSREKIPYLCGDKVEFTTTDIEYIDGIYLPVSIFVTAWARYELISIITANIDNYIYCDTDSVHLLTDKPNGIKLDNNLLGYWKNEGTAETAKFLRAKSYIKINIHNPDGTITHKKVTCAGMPENIKDICTLENFAFGNVFGGKLQQKRVFGGVLLTPTEFSLCEKYK